MHYVMIVVMLAVHGMHANTITLATESRVSCAAQTAKTVREFERQNSGYHVADVQCRSAPEERDALVLNDKLR